MTALILWLSLDRHGKDVSVFITLSVCVMVITIALSFLQPVISFIQKIQAIGNLDIEYIGIILKVVGIGMIGEICNLVCKDAGNESMGKALQICSAAAVLWLSIPVFEKLLSLLDTILGAA